MFGLEGCQLRVVVVFAQFVGLVVVLAEQTVIGEGELVPRHQLSLTERTPETLNVVDFVFRAHHKIRFSKSIATLFTLGPEQPGKDDTGHSGRDDSPAARFTS